MTVSPRQVLSLDSGWLFHLGDIAPPLPNTHLAAYMLNKAGYARVVRCAYRRTESVHDAIVELDNRERESLFVEAVA